MVNQNIVRAKIANVEKNLTRLKEKQNAALNEFLKNTDLQDIVLHNLQLAIQGCIDIASHIISDEGEVPPDTLAGLFDTLTQKRIIPQDLSAKLKRMVGFRNILIHEYQVIDLNKVYEILTQDLKDIHTFLKQVCVYAKL